MINIWQQTTNHNKKDIVWLTSKSHATKETNNNMYRPIENNHLFQYIF